MVIIASYWLRTALSPWFLSHCLLCLPPCLSHPPVRSRSSDSVLLSRACPLLFASAAPGKAPRVSRHYLDINNKVRWLVSLPEWLVAQRKCCPRVLTGWLGEGAYCHRSTGCSWSLRARRAVSPGHGEGWAASSLSSPHSVPVVAFRAENFCPSSFKLPRGWKYPLFLTSSPVVFISDAFGFTP